MEFKNCDSNTGKVKLYESVRKRPAEIFKNKQEVFGPSKVSENLYAVLNDVNKIDLWEYQVKVRTEEKQIKNGYSQ